MYFISGAGMNLYTFYYVISLECRTVQERTSLLYNRSATDDNISLHKIYSSKKIN